MLPFYHLSPSLSLSLLLSRSDRLLHTFSLRTDIAISFYSHRPFSCCASFFFFLYQSTTVLWIVQSITFLTLQNVRGFCFVNFIWTKPNTHTRFFHSTLGKWKTIPNFLINNQISDAILSVQFGVDKIGTNCVSMCVCVWRSNEMRKSLRIV